MRYDFAIIGGGIAGLSAAAALAPLGSCILLESENALGTQASGRSAAMFLLDYGNDVVRALNRASAEGHSDAGVLTPRAMLLLARSEDHAAWQAECADMGLDAITPSEAKTLFPILNESVVAYGGVRKDSSNLDTDLLMQHMRRTAIAAGAEIRTGAPVHAITKQQDHWLCSCPDQSVKAKTLINAAGAWADDIAKLAGLTPLGVQPYRRSMAQLPAPGGHDTTDWPFVLETFERWYAKPQSGKLIVSPSEADPMVAHDAFADDMTIAEGLARYEALVTEPVTRVETTWAGLRSFAPDHSLVVGRDATDPDFIWCAGQGGYGFQTAPAVSQLLGELMNGAPTTLDAATVAALDPKRFA